MLKAAIYQLDLKNLFIDALSSNIEKRFSNSERHLLKKIQQHNVKVQSEFHKKNINWDVWQNETKKIEGNNISVSLWKRNVSHDIFQGEFCNSCISLVKGNARANLHYLSDFNFSMVEIIEKNSWKNDRPCYHLDWSN